MYAIERPTGFIISLNPPSDDISQGIRRNYGEDAAVFRTASDADHYSAMSAYIAPDAEGNQTRSIAFDGTAFVVREADGTLVGTWVAETYTLPALVAEG